MVRVDVDGSVEVAWRAFEHRLAADLMELADGHVQGVEVPTGRRGRSSLALRFRGRPKTVLATVIGSPPVRGAGSRPRRQPPEGIPWSRVFRTGAEPEIATWAVGVLRDAYGVIHPAFLTVIRPAPSGGPAGAFAKTTHATGAADAASSSGGFVVPTSPEQLDDLVERTLSVGLSVPLVRDHYGDIALCGDHGTAYVRVRRHQPVVEVFAVLDGDVDPATAIADVNARNLSSRLVTYCVNRGYVMAQVAVWCHPYVPATLLRAVSGIMTALADYAQREPLAGDISDVEDGDDETSDELAPELLTIIQLGAADPGSVSPELAARIYGYDRDLLLSGIRESETQMIAWRKSIDEARERDEEEARVCAGESATWQATTDLLRAALRVAVER